MKKKDMNLRALLEQKLQALLDIETELLKALPKLALAPTDPTLRAAIEDHCRESEWHVKRAKEALDVLGKRSTKLKCEGIRGIIKDAQWVTKNVQGDDALDTAIIAAARYAEHYEMAGYLAAKRWADILGESYVSELLETTLAEEEKADATLEEISEDIEERANITVED